MADPHAGSRVLHRGAPLAEAQGVLVLLHGRGGSASDILQLGTSLVDDTWAMLAPQAAGSTWYPYSFLSAREQNEPWLSSSLNRVDAVLQQAQQAGVPRERVVLAGFSQGACLACEYAGTHATRYRAILAFTGGMVGPSSQDLRTMGDFQGTPVLLASGDPDPHVPWERVERTAGLFSAAGAIVRAQRYAGRPHTVSPAEIALAREMIAQL